jgi:hypothetical protein
MVTKWQLIAHVINVELSMDDAKRPRLVRIEGGGTAFIHPCGVCGEPNAPFGFGVSLLKGRPGTWRCAAHRDDVLQTEPVKQAPKKNPAPEPVKAPMPEPRQGDLF